MGKTKAVMMAHALGNPFDLATTLAFVDNMAFGLWRIIGCVGFYLFHA